MITEKPWSPEKNHLNHPHLHDFGGSSNMCDFPFVQKGCILDFVFGSMEGTLQRSQKPKPLGFRSLLSNDSNGWTFVVGNAGSFQGSGRRCVWWCWICLLLKCIHIFCILGKFRMYPRRITNFFFWGGRFYSFPVFQSSVSSSFTSSPGRNSRDRYMTCDAVDGKHARNTKQSTPLGAVVPWALHLGGSFFFCVCWTFIWLVEVLDSICWWLGFGPRKATASFLKSIVPNFLVKVR